MTQDKDHVYYLVELRCGACGIVFASSARPLITEKADELEAMFRKNGPLKFQRCKNGCSAAHPLLGNVPARDKNWNQKLIRERLTKEDLEAWPKLR